MNDQIRDLFREYMTVTGNFTEAAASLVLAHVLAGFDVQIDEATVKDVPATPINLKISLNGQDITPEPAKEAAAEPKLCRCPSCNRFFGSSSM